MKETNVKVSENDTDLLGIMDMTPVLAVIISVASFVLLIISFLEKLQGTGRFPNGGLYSITIILTLLAIATSYAAYQKTAEKKYVKNAFVFGILGFLLLLLITQ